jgi:U1 small nuclear ribonucleoprotein
VSGVAPYVNAFEDPKEVDFSAMTLPEQHAVRRARVRRNRAEKRKREIEEEVKHWHPQTSVTGDASKTILVARLSYEATERDVEKEFDVYGKIRRVTLIRDREGRPRGYGFVEYEEERAMKKAYKEADGTRVKGRRVLVDVERGRTTQGFRPRRLGGGLGKTRADKLSKRAIEAGETIATTSSSTKKRSRSRSRSRDRDRERRRK